MNWAFRASRFFLRSSRSRRHGEKQAMHAKSRHETGALRQKTAQNRLQDGHAGGNRQNFASCSQLGPHRCIVWRILTNFELVAAFFVRFGACVID